MARQFSVIRQGTEAQARSIMPIRRICAFTLALTRVRPGRYSGLTVTASQALIEYIEAFFSQASSLLWGWPAWPMPLMVLALLGTGLFLTARLRLINVRGFGHAIRVVKGDFDDPDDPGDVSHFQALTTALSATVGVGNIAGVATAIHYGGPGALLWMWITAILGMTTKFTECSLALRYRRGNVDGTVSGGPMYYIERGLGPRWKPLAIAFSACAVISSFATGNAIQAHTMADAIRAAYGVPTWVTGIVSATLVGLVIVGGIRRIGAVTARVVPIMAMLYLVGSVAILLLNYRALPAALVEIFTGALRPTAAVGGFAGAGFMFSLIWGVKRGLFSNEAGQGSAPIAHAAARTDEPIREGLVALLEPSIDTLLICTLTGLVIVSTGVWHDKHDTTVALNAQSEISFVSEHCVIGNDGVQKRACHLPAGRYPVRDGRPVGVRLTRFQSLVDDATLSSAGKPFAGDIVVDNAGNTRLLDAAGAPAAGVTVAGHFSENGEPLTAWAFRLGLAPIFPFGHHIVTICVFLFALSTAIGWSYYGDRSAEYLAGRRGIMPYRFVYLLLHFVGAVLSHEGVWGFGDVALGFMALPNLLAILLLSGRVSDMTRDYFGRYRKSIARRA